MQQNDFAYLSKYPICDTDIWVDVNLVHIENLLFDKYDKLIFADVVEGEILKFSKNGQYNFIANNYLSYRDKGRIIVINHTDFSDELRKLLEKQLFDLSYAYGFKFSDGLAYIPYEEHKGEIVSAMYAKQFNIPFLKSNDGTFKKGNAGQMAFPTVVVKNRRKTLVDLLEEYDQISTYFQKICDERECMNEQSRIYSTEPASMVEIQSLLNKFRKH